MTTVPLTIYDNRGTRTIIGSCDVEQREDGGWDISGIIEDERFIPHFEVDLNPDWYSVGYTTPDIHPIEAAYAPKLYIPDGRVRFTSHITLEDINTSTHPSNLREGK